MADGLAAPGGDVAANRELWTRVNAEYADEHAVRAWAAEEITWGIFDVPESQLQVLGDVSGLEVVELGCGTAYLSAWLARRGARPTGVDLTAAQLATARRCQDRFGIRFPLVEADAGDVPLPGESFDLAVSECGASLWCDPDRWVPEAARLLRPGGRLVFHTTSVLAAICTPAGSGFADQELVRPQPDVARVDCAGHGVQFHPGHGQWVMILRKAGFVLDALHELYAPAGTRTHQYYGIASARWASQWPAEELWAAHLPGPGAPGDG
ncbi:MAG TPA: class I SAM-dependent methyltransferase [Streptosporangiaceae bacterium]|nr:class I SAM-dependent methyltransferase [Streptosporangiaceae bacterium]